MHPVLLHCWLRAWVSMVSTTYSISYNHNLCCWSKREFCFNRKIPLKQQKMASTKLRVGLNRFKFGWDKTHVGFNRFPVGLNRTVFVFNENEFCWNQMFGINQFFWWNQKQGLCPQKYSIAGCDCYHPRQYILKGTINYPYCI